MHKADITSLLRKLYTEDYLEADNYGRWTIYKIKGKVDTSESKVVTSNIKVDTSDKQAEALDKFTDNQNLIGGINFR